MYLLGFLDGGVLGLSWWQLIVAALLLTHVTIAAVTIFLHRSQAHRALDLHPAVAHFFRAWLWLTTGMQTREWVAIHRKHHAKCETAEDPHSPQTRGLRKVLWQGAELYMAEADNAETLSRYGHGTPNDWLERNVYSRFVWQGCGLMLGADLVLFGAAGIAVWAVQMIWIPLFAAGVINGIGHYWGYRNYDSPDAATNISPWGILIGGEELLRLRLPASEQQRFAALRRWLRKSDVQSIPPAQQQTLRELLSRSGALRTLVDMRAELAAIWSRGSASREQMVANLQDWIARADASGIRALQEAALRIRSYAPAAG